MAVTFADCSVAEVPELQRFFATSYRVDYVFATNTKLLQWQFLGHSAQGPLRVRLARVGGAIAGCLGYIPVEVSVCGQVRHGAWGANWMVTPAFRSLGVGPLLMRDVTRQFDLTLIIGLSASARDILPRMGWTDLGVLRRWACVLDDGQAALLTASGQLEWPVAVQRLSPIAGATVEWVDHFASDVTELWDSICGRTGAGTRRTSAFLNWRYTSHPVFSYRLAAARGAGRLEGIAVYRVEVVRGSSVRVGRIVELLGSEAGVAALLPALQEDARSHDVAVLDYFCHGDGPAGLLQATGFVTGGEVDDQIPALFQPLDRRRSSIPFMAHLENLGQVLGPLSWYVTKGDGDQDRPN